MPIMSLQLYLKTVSAPYCFGVQLTDEMSLQASRRGAAMFWISAALHSARSYGLPPYLGGPFSYRYRDLTLSSDRMPSSPW